MRPTTFSQEEIDAAYHARMAAVERLAAAEDTLVELKPPDVGAMLAFRAEQDAIKLRREAEFARTKLERKIIRAELKLTQEELSKLEIEWLAAKNELAIFRAEQDDLMRRRKAEFSAAVKAFAAAELEFNRARKALAIAERIEARANKNPEGA